MSTRRGGERDGSPRRERILDAAVEEFGANGYAGARTAAIAARAGVNAQLITYYFGGKAGLLEALRERWSRTEAGLAAGDGEFVATVIAYADAALDDPSWSRLLAWQALEGRPAAEEADGGPQQRLRESLRRTRRRQRDGELRDDLDAELILVLAFSLALAPILLPGVVGALTGGGEPWAEYRRLLAEGMPRLVEARS